MLLDNSLKEQMKKKEEERRKYTRRLPKSYTIHLHSSDPTTNLKMIPAFSLLKKILTETHETKSSSYVGAPDDHSTHRRTI